MNINEEKLKNDIATAMVMYVLHKKQHDIENGALEDDYCPHEFLIPKGMILGFNVNFSDDNSIKLTYRKMTKEEIEHRNLVAELWARSMYAKAEVEFPIDFSK